MAKERTVNMPCPLVLVAPDAITVQCMQAVVEGAGLGIDKAMVGHGKGIDRICRTLQQLSPGIFVIAPATKLGLGQVRLVETARAHGSAVLAWTTATVDAGTSASARDEWLAAQLVEQAGARVSTRLRVLAIASAIYRLGSGTLSLKSTEIPRFSLPPGRASGFGARLKAAFEAAGISIGRRGKGRLAVDLTPKADPVLCIDGNGALPFWDPVDLAEACGILFSPGPNVGDGGDTSEFNLRSKALDGIVQPPARLLSEATSKRVLACAGINAPKERLCTSTTEAVRFAGSIDGPVVLKLVRPAFENKAALDGVHCNVQGPSAVRRAVHALGSTASKLGPPKPLGILVSEQISGGDRMWAVLEDHRTFGRILLIGQGDRPSAPPLAALLVSSSADQVRTAVWRSGVSTNDKRRAALAVAISRLARLLHVLGPRIDRAEIHPLVATDDNTQHALALDALIAIADPTSSRE